MRKSIISCFIILFTVIQVVGQYKVQFIVIENTAIKHDSIFITGTFNNWDSTANKAYLMKPFGNNQKAITLNLPPGTLRYKFHRGNWYSVEKLYNGGEVPDRVLTISKNVILRDTIEAWRDFIVADKKFALTKKIPDTTRLTILAAIAQNYAFWPEFYNADSALHYAQQALQLQQKIVQSTDNKFLGKENNYTVIRLKELIASLLHSIGNYQKALEIRLENLTLAENEKDKFILIEAMRNITPDFIAMKDFKNVLSYGKSIDSILNTLNSEDPRFNLERWGANHFIAFSYYNLSNYDSALHFAKKLEYRHVQNTWVGFEARGDLLLANIYADRCKNDSAYYYYRKTIYGAQAAFAFGLIANAHLGIARLFQKEDNIDSALFYAKQALSYYQNNPLDVQAWGENSDGYIAEISPLVANLYKANGQLDSAYKYLQLSVSLKDSLFNSDKIRQFQTLAFNESARKQQMEQERILARQEYETKVQLFILAGGILTLLIVAFILYRNNKQKQKANLLLQSQKQEIETTLSALKMTQSQLIQSEKMASLGELTAGIAHEIQNPLNFVNNFSEVSNELMSEMMEEIKKGNTEETNKIVQDIQQNLEKILHHGKRADAIVKGMLQHSRTSSGQKEPTDINALADEYLRLAYHGLRAKDKSFNATLKTAFDESVGNIHIIPQDVGRVILNLFTNAFYAVKEKKLHQQNGYDPTVSVITKRLNERVEIIIKDNGMGISQQTIEKIFQPFFTTKPAGQGTGLGLSMSYDIIVKGHGGELIPESEYGVGTSFTIRLPNI